MNSPIKIGLVDDHLLVREGIKFLLQEQTNFVIEFEAETGVEALEKLSNTMVDIVLTDIKMPTMSGIELTKRIKTTYPSIKILILSMFDDREFVKQIIDVEAEGYLLKNANRQELTYAIQHIMDDGVYYAKEIVDVISKINKTLDTHNELNLVNSITARELEILKLVCQELSNQQIADTLFISKETVSTHRKKLYKKLNVNSSVSLIRFAEKNNLA